MGNRSTSRRNEQGESGRGRTDGDDKMVFIEQLNIKYKELYKKIQPIPYIRDKMYSVDTIFVDGGIEYLAESWILVHSYQFMFDQAQVKSNRKFVKGEPGYGKSTLTLQLAYDWCNSVQTSYLKDVEILILLRLRQLRGVTSIYTAIKKFILPLDSPFTENDIEMILHHSPSVVIILDGFDEYPDEDSYRLSDIMKIIKNEMLKQFEVILTTRYLPKEYAKETKLLRLTGFDDLARRSYIEKAIAPSNSHVAKRITKQLKENPFLRDLCEVPLFFAMFAHMYHENEELGTKETVTAFFQYVIECLHSHMRNKMEDENVRISYMHEEYHEILDEVAFNSLRKTNRQIYWNRKKLRQRLGMEFYDQYIGIGVLIEEDIYHDRKNTSHQDDKEVRFYHKIFCEWYAAHHLAKVSIKESNDTLKKQLQDINPVDTQYLYRFACGLNKNAARQIIKYMKDNKVDDKFIMVCILEQRSLDQNIWNTVKELCSRHVTFGKRDEKLLQRSTIQLLETASRRKIYISSVFLSECNCTFNLSDGHYIWLKSNLPFPVLKTLTKLNIYETGRTITDKEITCILEYSAECKSMKEVRFVKCLLPNTIKVKSSRTLFQQETEVWWGPRVGFSDYRLNLFTGEWEVPRVSTGSSVRPLSERPKVDSESGYSQASKQVRPVSDNAMEKNSKSETTVMTDEMYQKVVKKIASYRTQMEYPEEYNSDLDDEQP